MLALAAALCASGCAALITPCSSYNALHTMGTGNCYECTNTYFEAGELDEGKSDYIMTKGRDGIFSPLRRPVRIMLKETDSTLRCKWCPQTQLCGHPRDTNSECPSADGRVDAGWEEHPTCSTSDQVVLERAAEQERRDNELVENMDDKERGEFLTKQAHSVSHPTDIRVLETRGLSEYDSLFDCRGPCVTGSGFTGCSEILRKTMPPAENHPDEVNDLMQQASRAPPGSSGRSACAFQTQETGVVPVRAVGRWSPSRKEWIQCYLTRCLSE